MKRHFTQILVALFLGFVPMQADNFESATEAVKNMAIGWNLGNTLDANNNGARQGLDSETCWGQPVTKPELLAMMKEAGFGAVRVPVTWMNHMDADGKVDKAWMERVHEVVDYVLDAGLYCILNVHHDTGSGSSHWLHASMDVYNSKKARYEYLWQQIADEFKEYGQELLFESYNEMLDKYDSWCFASYSRSDGYNATDAADAYNAINSYAQSFVNVVRASGGNNAQRNLVVNSYGACSGGGTWNNHLKDPLKELKYPDDAAGPGHIVFQVHTYPSLVNEKNGVIVSDRSLSSVKSEIDDMVKAWENHLMSKGAPVIVGEWGTSNVDKAETDYMARRSLMFQFVDYFVEKCHEKNIATFYWMGLSDGSSRSLPVFNQADLAERIISAYYGSSDGFLFPVREDLGATVQEVSFNSQWSELNLCGTLTTADYEGIELELAEKPAAGAFQFKDYPKEGYKPITEAVSKLTFNAATMGNTISRITLQSTAAGNKAVVKSVKLIRKDGTKTDSPISVFWGCTITETILSGLRPVSTPAVINGRLYNLQGQQVVRPQRGLYIRNGKKYVVK